jgi:UDP-N-acetylmuramoylalanine--D-glutamate ligase
VIGAGTSGLAAAELLRARGAEVVVNDRRRREALDERAHRLEARGVTLALGSHAPAFFEGAALVVVSPGVPPLPELAAVFRRVPEVIGEAELAARLLRAPLVGITGTNGKSTVTTLVGEMLRRSGFSTFVGGNLGVALSEAVGSDADTPAGRVVAELSSFQLETATKLRPKVAALINFSPDHLDRHRTVEAYGKAKSNIFAAQGEGDHAVLPHGDAGCAALGPKDPAVAVHAFGGAGEVRPEGGALVDTATGWRLPVDEIRLRGRHNLDNAAAAVLVARLAGADAEAMKAALREVGGLPHRAQLVRELDGVAWVDDSKATNVGAAAAALDGLASPARRAVLIAGGVDKGGSYAPLLERLARVGRGVVLIGKSADVIARAFASLQLPLRRAGSMEEAVRAARGLARPGDVVLLAPACASFDMYRSFAHRGDAFQEAVRALSADDAPGGDA